MAVAAEQAGIHFRTLNSSKGPPCDPRPGGPRAVPTGGAHPARRAAQPEAIPAGCGRPYG
jgi:hypothetical protein